jgi:hypothetical protein
VTRQFHEAVRNRLSARSPDLVPLSCVLMAVLVANLPTVLHLVTTNPLVINADLASPGNGWLPGLPYIDPNAGLTTQALGHLAALDWLHGHIPWWNPYEGVGAPLAGEMQSGAFFPLTMVLALHQGLLVLQLTLETVTGGATYFLIRRLGVGRSFATAAGVAFGLCGTYAWLAHAPIRPVVLLPLCLLGVERAVDAAKAHRRGGWALLSVALALSILAGFPETTFIDGLFVALWSILRIAGPGRERWRTVMAKLAIGVTVGVALAAPLITAFVGYLPYADVGGHNGGFAEASMPSAGLTQLILPYSLGPIFGFHSAHGASDTISTLWGNVGGFLTVTLIAAGLVGLVGKRHRTLRLGLGAWVLVCLLRTFGFPPVVHLMATLPGVRLTAFYRYSDPSWELAVVVLAALGLDDIARNWTRRRALVVAAIVTGILSGWAAWTAWPILTNATGATTAEAANRHLYAIGSLAAACAFLTVLTIGALMAGRGSGSSSAISVHQSPSGERLRRRGRVLMAAALSAESIILLGFTYLSAPSPAPLEAGSVSWLQAHLGDYRFVTFGPIQPDYGSYFGIAEANVTDLPVPKSWNQYIATHLDPNAPEDNFTGAARIQSTGSTSAQELSAELANYEAVGIRFVVESSNGRDAQGQPFPAGGAPPWPTGPRLVYQDNFAEIWQLPATAPVFAIKPDSAHSNRPASACTVTTLGWDRASVNCPRPSMVIRRVQFVPGWIASFDGMAESVQEDQSGPNGLFQQVAVPAGRTTLHFSYLPPHEDLALFVAAFAAVALVGTLVKRKVQVRRHGDAGNAAGW